MTLSEQLDIETGRADTYRLLLIDAMVMLKEIKRNREMPPLAETQQQYVALGDRIEEALRRNGDLTNTGDQL